jgi:hypothetical protein
MGDKTMKNKYVEALETLGFVCEHNENDTTIARIKIHGHCLTFAVLHPELVLGSLFEMGIDIGVRTSRKNYEQGYKDGKNHKKKL